MWQSGHRDLVLPRVLGHELCVRGEDGRRYAVWPGASCGRCQACRSGAENLCRAVAVLGFHRDGGISRAPSWRPIRPGDPLPRSFPGPGMPSMPTIR
ncbi:hypothetical protein [Halorhodospira halophila]|uniref:hypothetical protein n=1 Tax=Halorhodospira halophila TaxID=1053 RepID=UPI003D359C94